MKVIAGISVVENKENATGADLTATVVARDQNGTKMVVMGKWEGKTDTNAPQVSHDTHLGKKIRNMAKEAQVTNAPKIRNF